MSRIRGLSRTAALKHTFKVSQGEIPSRFLRTRADKNQMGQLYRAKLIKKIGKNNFLGLSPKKKAAKKPQIDAHRDRYLNNRALASEYVKDMPYGDTYLRVKYGGKV